MGRLCLLCFNVYRLRGYDVDCTNLKAYQDAKVKNPNMHAPFFAALGKFIRQHNDNPDSTRIKGADAIRNTSKLVAKTTSGSRLIKPRKIWVEMKEYEKNYGKPEEGMETSWKCIDGKVAALNLHAPSQ
eukprot:5039112-Pyramimonas_sp.AAC.1